MGAQDVGRLEKTGVKFEQEQTVLVTAPTGEMSVLFGLMGIKPVVLLIPIFQMIFPKNGVVTKNVRAAAIFQNILKQRI